MARGATRSVGLEIDTGIIRAVEAAGTANSPKLISMAHIPLPEGAVEEGMVTDPVKVGEALRDLWNSGTLKHRKVLLGVANQGVLVRYSTIPKVPKEKMDNVIRFHAQELLPIPLDSVVMDYMVIGEREDEGSSLLEILLVAARRDMLNGFISALNAAKLEAADVDVSTLAMMRILPLVADRRTVAMVNVSNGLSNILVSASRVPRLARLVSVKINDLAEILGCPLTEVLLRAGHGGRTAQDKYFGWLRSLIAETRSSLNYYQNQNHASEIEAIILNGRGARLSGIATMMQDALELPVKIVNPFEGFSNANQKTGGSGLEAVDFAISAGLARRGLEGS